MASVSGAGSMVCSRVLSRSLRCSLHRFYSAPTQNLTTETMLIYVSVGKTGQLRFPKSRQYRLIPFTWHCSRFTQLSLQSQRLLLKYCSGNRVDASFCHQKSVKNMYVKDNVEDMLKVSRNLCL